MAEVRILLASSLRCDTSFLNEDAEFFAVQASTGTSTSGLAHRSQPISITPLFSAQLPPPQLPPPRIAFLHVFRGEFPSACSCASSMRN
jgi:hypothetical protein